MDRESDIALFPLRCRDSLWSLDALRAGERQLVSYAVTRVPRWCAAWSRGLAVALVLSLSTAAQAAEWNYLENTAIDWRGYGAGAFKEAGVSRRPVFVLVYADWCKWCKKYELETLEQPEIRRRLAREWVPVAVNYDENPELARRLGVKLVPTTLLLTPEAKKLQRFFGVIDAQALAGNLDRVLDMWRRGEMPEADFGDESTCCPLPGPEAQE